MFELCIFAMNKCYFRVLFICMIDVHEFEGFDMRIVVVRQTI